MKTATECAIAYRDTVYFSRELRRRREVIERKLQYAIIKRHVKRLSMWPHIIDFHI